MLFATHNAHERWLGERAKLTDLCNTSKSDVLSSVFHTFGKGGKRLLFTFSLLLFSFFQRNIKQIASVRTRDSAFPSFLKPVKDEKEYLCPTWSVPQFGIFHVSAWGFCVLIYWERPTKSEKRRRRSRCWDSISPFYHLFRHMKRHIGNGSKHASFLGKKSLHKGWEHRTCKKVTFSTDLLWVFFLICALWTQNTVPQSQRELSTGRQNTSMLKPFYCRHPIHCFIAVLMSEPCDFHSHKCFSVHSVVYDIKCSDSTVKSSW